MTAWVLGYGNTRSATYLINYEPSGWGKDTFVQLRTWSVRVNMRADLNLDWQSIQSDR